MSYLNPFRTFIFTLLAVMSFASNSLLCRFALKQTRVDAATFTFVRIFSGAAALWIILSVRELFSADRTAALVPRSSDSSLVTRLPRRSQAKAGHSSLHEAGTWLSALALFIYTAAFTFAYNTLSAGTGALLLFGAVQATMIFWGLRQGETLHALQLVGLTLALTGLVVLLFPGLSAPPVTGSILMIGAGIAWGIYSLRGKSEKNPAGATAGNFLHAAPMALAVSIISIPWMRLDRKGIGCAVLSGAITSGLAYIIWYKAVSALRAAAAATVQLSVPVLTATGGILLLGEPITLRYVLACITILGGIALVVIEKQPAT